MFLIGGNIHVPVEWEVQEPVPPGYIRVYWVYGGATDYYDGYGRRRLLHDKIYIFPSAAPYSMETDLQDRLNCTFLHIDVRPVMVKRLVCMDAQGVPGAVLEAVKRAYEDEKKAPIPYLVDALAAACLENGAFDPPSSFVKAVHEFISDGYGKPMPVRTMSQRFGYNEQYFIRRFKAEAGISPHQYLTEYRFKEAIHLLRGEGSVEAIAEAVGFADAKTFCRAFANRYGVSPGRFRKMVVIA